jgi:hypothetical protein
MASIKVVSDIIPLTKFSFLTRNNEECPIYKYKIELNLATLSRFPPHKQLVILIGAKINLDSSFISKVKLN